MAAPKIVINDNYQVTRAEIGLVTANKQLFDNVYAEQDITNDKVTVSFRVKSTMAEAFHWTLTEDDTLYIHISGGDRGEVFWLNWSKPNDQWQKGFCIPMHNVEWMKHDNENKN